MFCVIVSLGFGDCLSIYSCSDGLYDTTTQQEKFMDHVGIAEYLLVQKTSLKLLHHIPLP